MDPNNVHFKKSVESVKRLQTIDVNAWTNIPFPVCDAIEDLQNLIYYHENNHQRQNKVLLDIIHLMSYNTEVIETRVSEYTNTVNDKCGMIYRSVLHEKDLMSKEAAELSKKYAYEYGLDF